MPIAAIVGRPNVGKSSLFNRLVRRRVAIVEDRPGVTRDRIYADLEWQGRRFTLIDTGGLVPGGDEGFEVPISRQVELAVEEADLIILLVDAREGPTPVDEAIARQLRRAGKPILLAVNKVDTGNQADRAAVFYRLGLGEPIAVSAEHGFGTGDLLDAIVQRLPGDAGDEPGHDRIHVAVVGRPNVGKSSLVNALLGQERVIVSQIPGTTRDAVDVPWSSAEGEFLFIDTAGMRRRSRVSEEVEYYSVVRARRALDRAHVALVLVDAGEGLTEQDKRVAGLAAEANCGLIVLVNKWDLLHGSLDDPEDALRAVRDGLPQLHYAPVLAISALTGRGLSKLPQAILKVFSAYDAQVPTTRLNRVLQDAVDRHHPPSIKGRRLRIRYVTQVRSRPPTFVHFVNDPRLATAGYRRYLENRIRAAFPLEGTPIRLLFRRSS